MPDGVIFRTKRALALAMVADAVASGLPFRWVAGDSVYGDSPTFCQGVRALHKWYVLDSSADARVWGVKTDGDMRFSGGPAYAFTPWQALAQCAATG